MNQNNSKVIAVFGGSRPAEQSSEYVEAYTVGKLLAQNGFIVMNGGYAGTMEASARGARENGGRSIGILSDEFHYLAPNPYIDETMSSPDLFSRIREMQMRADGFIVLKGSMGTLAELSLVWNLAKIDLKHRKPIILIGNSWVNVLQVWRDHLGVTEEEASLLQVVYKPEDAVELLCKQL
ncbi:MAG: LOG family protein [Chloroflexi bacterium]|nr:LOG family protein [Chloroflexota bacterium]